MEKGFVDETWKAIKSDLMIVKDFENDQKFLEEAELNE